MISPDRLLAQKQIYNFLRSLTIKYEPIARYLNETLVRNGHTVNDQDPTTWKYYLNMVGKYHPADTLMYVTSLDTRETILFSPETLAKNLRTRAVYMPGGLYYNKLCDLYPDQVDLIKSILFPVEDMAKAIAAPDLTLLNYGKGYLEIYEESVFIMEIEKFLEILVERWYFDFLDDEPYFYLTFWSTLPIYLAMLLMSGRMGHIRTPFVHSADLWDELKAHGIDNYSDVLDREKQMLLYQNIDYFKENAGKQSNLIILAERLLASFGIGLYGRKVTQESETGASNYQLTPQLAPVRIPRSSEALPAEIEIKRVSEVQAEIYEKGLTPSDAAETVAAVERKLGDTTLNEFSTKFIELRPVAQNKPYAETLNGFLMGTLVTSIVEDYYTIPVEVFDPLTKYPIYLPPKELLALYSYAVNKSMRITLETFPTSVNLYRSFLPVIGTPSKTILYDGQPLYLSAEVDVAAYLSGLDYDKNIQNPLEFSDNATNLWLRFLDHTLKDQSTLIDTRHYAYEYLSSLCHSRRRIDVTLVDGYGTYEEWLGKGGIDIEDTILSQYAIQADPEAQWANLADAILSTLLPINDVLRFYGNFTLSNSGYERLRELFVQMLSYRVVVLESDRETADYAIGAKWSNHYGRIDMDQYLDCITTLQTYTTDQVRIIEDLYVHKGFHADIDQDMLSNARYTVTTAAIMQSSHVDQPIDRPALVPQVTGTNMMQSTSHRTYAPALPAIADS